MTLPKEAIDAVLEEANGRRVVLFEDDAQAILSAALPQLEKQIRTERDDPVELARWIINNYEPDDIYNLTQFTLSDIGMVAVGEEHYYDEEDPPHLVAMKTWCRDNGFVPVPATEYRPPEAIAATARVKERERCAKFVEDNTVAHGKHGSFLVPRHADDVVGPVLASAIREGE